MKKKIVIPSVLFIIIIIQIISTIGMGCANIVPPQGGPRDSLPPVLLKAEPGDSARNFKGNKIVFNFDEFVEVQNIQEQLLVSPLPQTPPQVDSKLKTVTLKLKDSLEENTTYTFNFGNALKDFSEGNVLKNFTYTFSTGNTIDSLKISGKVILAETGKTDSTLIVMLHTSSDDSVVIKEKPKYITRLDSSGNFTFKNLPAKTFYVYTLKDQGGQRKYQNKKQLFGFAEKPVSVASQKEPLVLYAYVAEKEKTPAAALAALSGSRGKNASDNRLRINTNLANKQQDLLGAFEISFERPLKTFDTAKIRLFTDSVFSPVSKYAFIKDSTGKKVKLDISWKENTEYHIILDKDFAEDTSGKKLLKTDTISFTTRKKSDYGSLKLKIRNLDMARNPVLQIIQNGEIIKSAPLSGQEYSSPMSIPGEYELRILYDENKNGAWDPGEFFGKHKQPEKVVPINRKLNIKANWQNEFEIAL